MTHSHGRIDLATRKLCVSVPWDCAAYDAPNQIQHQSTRLIINSRQGFFEIEEHCLNRSQLLKGKKVRLKLEPHHFDHVNGSFSSYSFPRKGYTPRCLLHVAHRRNEHGMNRAARSDLANITLKLVITTDQLRYIRQTSCSLTWVVTKQRKSHCRLVLMK
jgi:hypothetical protein